MNRKVLWGIWLRYEPGRPSFHAAEVDGGGVQFAAGRRQSVADSGRTPIGVALRRRSR